MLLKLLNSIAKRALLKGYRSRWEMLKGYGKASGHFLKGLSQEIETGSKLFY
jgi:hypothetical protein